MVYNKGPRQPPLPNKGNEKYIIRINNRTIKYTREPVHRPHAPLPAFVCDNFTIIILINLYNITKFVYVCAWRGQRVIRDCSRSRAGSRSATAPLNSNSNNGREAPLRRPGGPGDGPGTVASK